MEVLDKVKVAQSAADIQAVLGEPGYSDYVVVYMRLITSGHMQKNADFYVNFLDGHPTVKDFCALVSGGAMEWGVVAAVLVGTVDTATTTPTSSCFSHCTHTVLFIFVW